LAHVVIILEQYANTFAAALPTALAFDIQDGKINSGQSLLLNTFGVDFVWYQR
jgi:3-oxoacyl-[acyl-carrier-protein] synthase III